jgi:hypothetical protein
MLAATGEGNETVTPVGQLDAGVLGTVYFTDRLHSALLMPLLVELREERCAHSWQPILAKQPPAAAFTTLERIVAGDRPGCTLTYYRDTPSGYETLAVGVVSDRIAITFPVDGLPVLGRAFVRPAHRRKSLYATILRHRFDYCLKRWGSGLMGIHLGTASAGVERVFCGVHTGRVVYLGDEDLGEAGVVRALLAIADTFDRELQESVPAILRHEHAHVMAFLRAGATTTRACAIAAPLRKLAECHAGFDRLHHFLSYLPTLR